jgi:hypothetical protein
MRVARVDHGNVRLDKQTAKMFAALMQIAGVGMHENHGTPIGGRRLGQLLFQPA